MTSHLRVFRGAFPLLLGLAALSCGSETTREPKTPDAEAGSARDDGAGDSGGDASDDTESSDGDADSLAESAAPSDPCADGSCFRCGSGVCPAGFYCDEGAQGGPGCSWLPDCGAKSTCQCLERTLDGCTCTEKSGAAFVTCS